MLSVRKSVFAPHIREAIEISCRQSDMMKGLDHLFFCNMAYHLPHLKAHASFSKPLLQDYFKAVEVFKRYMRIFHYEVWQKAVTKNARDGVNENSPQPS